MMTSGANLMWRSQEFLHQKNSPIVPGFLMLVAGSLVVYRHMTVEHPDQDHLKTFLAMIVIQMLPLVALEVKIMECADPVGLFCKFAAPVTLMHGIFLLMRVCQYPLYEQGYLIFSVAGLAGAAVTMHKGFRMELGAIFQHSTVWNLVALALVAAACTEYAEVYFGPAWLANRSWRAHFTSTLSTANSYIELMAFVPAVWMMYRESTSGERMTQIDSIQTRRTSTAFFLFLVIFYFAEDVLQAYEAFVVSPLAAIAHVAHFLLLSDFAFYVLAHVYNPEKLIGELRKWLPADLACAV